MLRRAATIPSTEEEGEDETKSVNSEKAIWDEPSETVDDSFIDEPKAEDEIPYVSFSCVQKFSSNSHDEFILLILITIRESSEQEGRQEST